MLKDAGGKKMEFLDTSNGLWSSVKIETTTIRITSKTLSEHQAEMQSGSHRPVINGWVCITNPSAANYAEGDSLTLQWYMDFHLHWYPWEKFSSLMLEKQFGPDMESGLENLKSLLER